MTKLVDDIVGCYLSMYLLFAGVQILISVSLFAFSDIERVHRGRFDIDKSPFDLYAMVHRLARSFSLVARGLVPF